MKPLAEIPRRTIDELVSLYSLEPSITDVFVEGPCDQRLLRWFVDSELSGGAEVGIYTVDEIEVRSELVKKYGRTPGNRSEILVLCSELEAVLGRKFGRATGVIDQDMSLVIPDGDVSHLVLKTDFACLDAYIFSVQNLEKLRALSFMKVKKTAAAIIETLTPILKFLFAVRVANEKLGTKFEWIDFSSFVSVEENLLKFRHEDFLRSYLRKGNSVHQRGNFIKEVASVSCVLPEDYRSSMNGHDAVALLGIYLRSFHKKAEDVDRTKPHVLRYLLCCCTEASQLRNENMFSSLLGRLNKSKGGAS